MSRLRRWWWRRTHRPYDWEMECPELWQPVHVRRVWPDPVPDPRPDPRSPLCSTQNICNLSVGEPGLRGDVA